MKKLFVCAVAVACLLSSPAVAINLIYEPFDYTPGLDLGPPDSSVTYGLRNTQAGTTAGTADNSTTGAQNYPDGGTGNKWLRASVPANGPADAIDIATGSLLGPSDLPAAIGNSLTITNGSVSGNPADRLAFNPSTVAQGPPTGQNITSGTIYYSFLLRVDSLDTANNVAGNYLLSLNNTANANTTTDPTVVPGQFRLRVDPTDGTKFSIGTFTNRQTMTQADPAWFNGLTVGDTHFIVGALNVGTTNSTRLWVNPDASVFGDLAAPTADRSDNTSAANGNTIGSFLLHQRNSNPELALDELRVATTWAEVTPIGTVTRFWDIDALGSTVGAGGATPSGTWDAATTNWNTGANGVGTKEAWTPGIAAVFSAGTDATGAYTITVSGTQSVSSILFEDGSPTLTGGTLDFSGLRAITAGTGVTAKIESVVTGSTGIEKNGAGTVVLTAAETYSGATAINAGTLQIGDGGTAGSLPTGSVITTLATLAFNQTDSVTQGVDFSGTAIGGTGGLTQAGSGTLTLNTANTFSGTTRAAAGTLLLTDSLALQNSTLDLNGSDTGAVTFDGSLSAATVGALSGSRNFALVNGASGALALTVGNNSASYSGALSGAGSLTKAGTGTQTLSGTNTYGGGTTINGGTLQFAQAVSMPTSGAVTVNSGGTLAVNAGGTGEWTDSAVTTDPASIAGLIAGTGGQGTANQVTWIAGSALGIDTTNAPGAPTAPALTYGGVIGSFRTTGGGTTNAVGFTKRGAGTLVLSGSNTFSGQLSVAPNGGTLQLTGTNANAGTSMTIPTVGIGTNGILQLGVSNSLPSGTLINTQGPAAQMFVQPTFSQTIRSMFGNNGVVTVQADATLTIADQAGDNYVFGNGAGTANLRSEVGAKVDKTGPGTFTLNGDNGNNFNGQFLLQNGRLNLSRNQSLGSGATGRLTITGGQMGNTLATGNLTFGIANLDLHVFRYDLSDAPITAQFGSLVNTILRQDTVEFNITNSGTQTPSSGRFVFLGEIKNYDLNPGTPYPDTGTEIRGIRKTGNGVLSLGGSGGTGVNTYKGTTTVDEGVLLMVATATLGDYTGPTYGTLNLKGGVLATSADRTTPVKNPVVVDGNVTLAHFSTTGNLTSVKMDFDNDSVVGTSGSLTISNLNNSTTGNLTFKALFTGKNFNFGLPVAISSPVTLGASTKSSELQLGNLTDTQTFSGVISGGGSLRRLNAGGTSVLSGANTYTGGTFVDDGILKVSGTSAKFGGGNVTVNGGQAEIAAAVANAIIDTATLTLLGGGTAGVADTGFITLATGINERVVSLVLGAAAQTNGTYGTTGSGAANINDEYFAGLGIITVGPAPLPGDFNSDGKVDAGDYVTWKKNQNTNNALANDNGLGTPVGTAHYDLWRANFGNPPGAGSGGGLDGTAAVPEPASLMLLVCAAGTALVTCGRRKR